MKKLVLFAVGFCVMGFGLVGLINTASSFWWQGLVFLILFSVGLDIFVSAVTFAPADPNRFMAALGEMQDGMKDEIKEEIMDEIRQ
jgi:hypothetical protein